MGFKIYNDIYFTSIANALREKTLDLSSLAIKNFKNEILNIDDTKFDNTVTSLITNNRSNIYTIELATTLIRDCTFADCVSLTTVSFSACTNIGSSAFRNCTLLASISFPRCTKIGNCAFQSCISLTSINFPICSSIGALTFADCTSLTSVSFPDIKIISNSAFENCIKISSLNFPNCITISEYAFRNCISLKTLVLGTSNCYIRNSNAFTSVPLSVLSICVPASYADAYKTSTNWSYFSSRIFGV